MHALVGENGAGKSTLGRIVAGALAARRRAACCSTGEPVSFRSPREALEHGVAAIAQEPSIVPQLTVAENVFLGREPRCRRLRCRRRSLARAYAALAATGRVRPRRRRCRPAGCGPPSSRRSRSCARSRATPQLIVMDEPTAALERARDRSSCTRSSARSPRAGTTILLISHFLREVLDLADTVTVLRDGEVVRTAPTSAETESSLVEAMLGRPLTSTFPPKQRRRAPTRRSCSRCASLRAPGRRRARASSCAPARSSALAGLVGAGRTELARALFGAARVRVGDGRCSTTGATRSAAARAAASRRARDDPRVAQGRRPDLRALVGRERDALAARRRSARSASCAARASGRPRARVLERCDVRGAPLLARRCARSRAATSRRCCSPGRCCASRAS